jgi:hypothetical protein
MHFATLSFHCVKGKYNIRSWCKFVYQFMVTAQHDANEIYQNINIFNSEHLWLLTAWCKDSFSSESSDRIIVQVISRRYTDYWIVKREYSIAIEDWNHFTPSVLNVLVQIANKMGLQKKILWHLPITRQFFSKHITLVMDVNTMGMVFSVWSISKLCKEDRWIIQWQKSDSLIDHWRIRSYIYAHTHTSKAVIVYL